MPEYNNTTHWQGWLQEHRHYWVLLAVAATGLLLGRVALIISLAPEHWQVSNIEMARAFWIGLRFDLKYLALILGAPVLILGIGLRLIPQPSVITCSWQRIWPIYTAVVLLFVNIMIVVNHGYFKFYQSPINDVIFGLAEDDTHAILSTIWHDFPVLWLFGGIILLTTAQWIVAQRCARKPWFSLRTNPLSQTRTIALIALCSLLATIGLIRGSISKFPLRSMHMAVSNDAFTNHLVPSGVTALYQAWQARRRYDLGNDADSGLKYYGFSSAEEAMRAVGYSGNKHGYIVPPWPENRSPIPPQPHVVLAVMESWGRQMMDFDDAEDNDLLGRLRPWLMPGRLDYFERAVSSNLGTHPSLEALLLDTPLTPLTQNHRYGHIAYDTARARVYQQAGYHTVYLTAGPEAWRDLNTVLLHQGFDEMLGEQAILKRFPEATTHTWGVDDEWMFRYAEELLAQADARQQPLLLVMMSVTNHPPYRIPPHYTPAPLDVSKLGTARATDEKTALSILQTYQYANDALGDFLNHLHEQGLLERTLLAATGDHNQRTIFSYPDNQQLYYKYGVPIVFYIPENYRIYGSASTRNWSSHQDIFPTLWAHSLWGHKVPHYGRNVYAQHDQADYALSFIDNGIIVNDSGAVVNLAKPIFYHWDEVEGKPVLVSTTTPNDKLRALYQRERAKLALRDWQIRSQALEKATLNH